MFEKDLERLEQAFEAYLAERWAGYNKQAFEEAYLKYEAVRIDFILRYGGSPKRN